MEMNKIFSFLGLSGGENQYSLGVDKCLLLLALNTEIELSHTWTNTTNNSGPSHTSHSWSFKIVELREVINFLFTP